jgi:hypothetical protein
MADRELSKANKGYKQHYEDERKENEETRAIPKKILGAMAAVPAGLAGLAASANKDFPGPIDSARISGKMAYHSVTGDKKGLDKDTEEFDAAVKRNKSVERKKDEGDTTNPMGDKYRKGGKVSSASKRADGCAIKGKTKGRMV